MKFIVSDWETFFDSANGYTLKSMTTEQYLRDPRFKAHGCAIKFGPELPAKWWDASELKELFAQIDWSDVFIVHHHAQFDSFIENHHYGIKPKMIGCSLSCARLLLGNHVSVSLDSVRKHFGMPSKLTPYKDFDGKKWTELTPVIQQQIADGACDEVESIWKIFKSFLKDMPLEELDVIDSVIRMYTEPVLRGDIELLAKVWEQEATSKQSRLEKLNVSEADLQSADRFAQLLRDAGVEPEMKQGKISTKTGNSKLNYAFAKTDSYMQELLEHDDEYIRTLVEARLGVKSTLMQTRAETLGWVSRRGFLPVYLRYAGTGTLRSSGGEATNWLNFKRGSDIRRAILAPEGYLLAPVDSSQIEFRVCMWLAGQEDILEQLRRGEDPYIGIASEFYGEKIYKPAKDDLRKLEMEQKRGAGKQAKLMCQYGAAGEQFQKTAKAGLYGPPINMAREDADRFVKLYRDTHPAVMDYWKTANHMLARLAGEAELQWGILTLRDHRIYLPNGCPLLYDTLEFYKPNEEEQEKLRDFEKTGYWRVKTKNGWKTMWGSKLVQNICEAVARVIVSQAMIRLKYMGYRTLNWPYDELLILIKKDGNEQQHLEVCMNEMRRTPEWLPGIPLDCEGSLGERYSK